MLLVKRLQRPAGLGAVGPAADRARQRRRPTARAPPRTAPGGRSDWARTAACRGGSRRSSSVGARRLVTGRPDARRPRWWPATLALVTARGKHDDRGDRRADGGDRGGGHDPAPAASGAAGAPSRRQDRADRGTAAAAPAAMDAASSAAVLNRLCGWSPPSPAQGGARRARLRDTNRRRGCKMGGGLRSRRVSRSCSERCWCWRGRRWRPAPRASSCSTARGHATVRDDPYLPPSGDHAGSRPSGSGTRHSRRRRTRPPAGTVRSELTRLFRRTFDHRERLPPVPRGLQRSALTEVKTPELDSRERARGGASRTCTTSPPRAS